VAVCRLWSLMEKGDLQADAKRNQDGPPRNRQRHRSHADGSGRVPGYTVFPPSRVALNTVLVVMKRRKIPA
jgi:hypothetical protein